mmetsp:Transcript_29511/g.65009  ORF Transcript_29511/g.65009 Transcript_29511/m.65009 type:complete len:1964 (+) Transcript_29511:229-6120(+)|eukprot:CAMPEP_0178489294 /NCGR_PEP_ID=MMETSP0696-20121128/10302_1 /TAXON_ID=265572 /ORGANISM="Extubocellulus spinifer, Strain CCMP396" /LENGTH=1963 /DNA_ID=CAMNT_0020117091 /DNA_START=185 /DNA_END=6076 /DNA_ORIENTATION=+
MDQKPRGWPPADSGYPPSSQAYAPAGEQSVDDRMGPAATTSSADQDNENLFSDDDSVGEDGGSGGDNNGGVRSDGHDGGAVVGGNQPTITSGSGGNGAIADVPPPPPQDPATAGMSRPSAASSEPSYDTMGKTIGLPTDVEHIEEVEWANPEDLQPGRYTDRAARPPYDRVSDPCGCVPDGSDNPCCLDMSCVLFACQEECRSNCEAGDLCGNKRIQRREWKELQVFDAGPKGRGLRIMEPLKKGDFICEYVGVAIKKEHLDSLFARYQGERMLYIMALDNDVYIDARKKGGIARYINHSCEPNCMVDRWKVRGVSRACVFAIRDIDAGEELSFDYKWTRKRGRAPTKCHCGTEACRGTLEMPKDISLEDEELDLKLSGHWKVPITQNPGNEIINRVIKVYFDGDREYYAADVAQYDEKTGKHQIIYKSDLSDAWENLSKLQWMILDREYEQFIIAKKSARMADAPLGTPVGPAQQSMAKNYILVQTYVKEALMEWRIIAKCQNHCRVRVDILTCDKSEIDSAEGTEAVQGSADGKLWKLVVTGMDPVKARVYLEHNVETITRKTAEAAAKEAAKSALDAKSASSSCREVVIPRSIVDEVKRKLHQIRFSTGRNVEVNFIHSESKSKQFAKLTIQAESNPDLQRALENIWKELFKLCAENGTAELTSTGVFKDLGILGGELTSDEFNLLFQNLGHNLSQDCSENLRDSPFFSSFEDMHRCSIWVQAAGDMGRIDSQNRVVGEAGSDVSRKVFFGADPKRIMELWNHIRGRVNDLLRGVKFFNLGPDRVYFPALTQMSGSDGVNRAGNDFFDYIQRTTGASVRVDNLTRNHLRIDGGDKTKENGESDRRIAVAEELIRLQIEVLRDHSIRKQRWAFGRDWTLLMDVDPEVRKKENATSAASRASPTPGAFSAARYTSDSRAVVTSVMEIAEICSLLELDRAVAAHASIIFYRFLNQVADVSITAATNVKLREAALACLFIANKAQKLHKWRRLERVLAAAYETFYPGAKFNEKSEEAANWEKRVLSAETELLATLEYDIFWPGSDWIISAVVESGKVPEPLAVNAMDLAFSGPVLAAGPTIWLKFGPEYAFAAIAGLLSINMDSIFGALPILPMKVMQAAQLIVKSIQQNASTAKKYSKAAHAQLFQGSQMSLLNNAPHVEQACMARINKGMASPARVKDVSKASAWEKSHIIVARRSRRSRIIKDVGLALVRERILPFLDGICAESRCSVFFQEGSYPETENIVLEGSWRAISIAEFLLQSVASSSPAQAASEQSRSLGLTHQVDSSLDLAQSSKAEAEADAPPQSTSTHASMSQTADDMHSATTLPPSEDLDSIKEGVEKKQAKLKPGVMRMCDIEITSGWSQSGDTAGVEARSEGKLKIGGKTCIPAVAPEASLKLAGLRWWIPPQYGQSLSGSLCDILSIRKSSALKGGSHLHELAKLASSVDTYVPSDREGPSFPMLKSFLSTVDTDNLNRDNRSVAISVQQWPPGKIDQKEKSRKEAMRVGFSPTALQEMQLLQQLHHLIPAPQGHPNFILPVAVAVEEPNIEGEPDSGGIGGLFADTSSSNNDVVSLLSMIKNNPLEDRSKRQAGSGSYLVFQPTPLILQKVVSRTIKKRDSSGDSKRGVRLITPTIFASWFHDLLTAMSMCHSNHIVIRNINPDQILVDYSGVATLSGFNRAIVLPTADRRNVIDPLESSLEAKQRDEIPADPFVAPEILLGSSRYTKETDIFSLGCLMAQLLLNRAIFAGRDRKAKVGAMYKVIGSPGTDNFPSGKLFPYYKETKPEKKYKRGIEKAFHFMKDSDLDLDGEYAGAVDLLGNLLHLDPTKRISAADALEHEFMVKHMNDIKSDKFRTQFVQDWIHLRDSVLLDTDQKRSGTALASSPLNRTGLLQKKGSEPEEKVDLTKTTISGEREKKRKALLMEAAAGGDGDQDVDDDEDELYNMDEILNDAKPAGKKKQKIGM